MKQLNFHEYKNLQKQLAGYSQKELGLYIENIYASGFNDAKKAIGIEDSDIYVWDEDKLYKVLIDNCISERLAKKIIGDLEK